MRDLCEIESQTTYFQANKQICLREIYVRFTIGDGMKWLSIRPKLGILIPKEVVANKRERLKIS